jgi:phosphatidylserine synthase
LKRHWKATDETMPRHLQIPQKVTAVLVYGRLPLVFGGLLCALVVMWTRSPEIYTLGVVLLIISMSFDLVDGWFAARFTPHATLAYLADRIMDKVVFATIFPLAAVGMMWRLSHTADPSRLQLLHAIFVLLICIVVLFRDNFAHFIRGFAGPKGPEPEPSEFTRLRTVVAAPVGALLYAHAFFVPEGPTSFVYYAFSWLGNLPIRVLFFIEILFLIINFGSIARYCRKYGAPCLDELCLGDEMLRRRILSIFPNALTVMNAVMGLLAVFFAYQYRIREAYLFLIGAALFDKLDGAVARRLGLTEPLPGMAETPGRINVGAIMDDIADAVSFCIVPAWIFYLTIRGPAAGGLPIGAVALLYAMAGIARLIYFTLDTSPIPGFFKGLPTPAAALLVVSPLIIFSQAVEMVSHWARFWALFSFWLMIAAALLMNLYPVRYLHLGRYMSRKPWFGRASGLIILIFIFTPYFGHAALIYLFGYLLSPLFTGRVDPDTAEKEGTFNSEGETKGRPAE